MQQNVPKRCLGSQRGAHANWCPYAPVGPLALLLFSHVWVCVQVRWEAEKLIMCIDFKKGHNLYLHRQSEAGYSEKRGGLQTDILYGQTLFSVKMLDTPVYTPICCLPRHKKAEHEFAGI